MKENIIEIILKNKEDYINKYNENKLSSELSEYILEEAKNLKTKQKISLKIIHQFEMNNKEKDKLVDMIRSNFGVDVSEIMNVSRKEKYMNILLLIIGLLFLIIYALFNRFVLISELMLIIGWVFIGEAICNILYHGIENRLRIIRRSQIINGKIEFEEKK